MTFPASPAELSAPWLEDALRRDAGLLDARVRGLSTEVIGMGFGLDGTTARVTIDGDGVPSTLVAKWCKQRTGTRETRFYREIAPRLDLRLARLFAARIDEPSDRALLVLSDVAPAEQGDVLVGATPEQADAMIDAMAGFHAPFWGAADDAVVAALPAWGGNVERSCGRTRERLPRFLAEWEGRLPRAALAVAAALPEREPRAYAALAAAPATLVHADLHLDNVLFLPDGTPVILDWTDVSRGPAAVDVARLLVECSTSDLRRTRQDALVARYATRLAARGVRGIDADGLRRDVADMVTVLFAAALRWSAGPEGFGPDVPRVPRVVESLVRRSADAAIDPAWHRLEPEAP